MQTGPGRRANGIPLGLFFFILYYVFYTIGRLLSENLLVPTLVGMWLPSLLFAGLTLYVFRRVEQERPIIPDQVQNWVLDLLDRYFFPILHRVRKLFTHFLHEQGHEYIPYQNDATPDGMQVHASTRDRIYHLPGCEFYDCPQCTLKFKDAKVAAEAGFKPCRLCNEA